MAEIRHLENRHDVIFFSAEGGPIWIKFRRLVQNDMSTAVIRSNSKPDVEFQYGGRLGEFRRMSSQCHLLHCRVSPPGEFNVMIPELCVTLQGAATWWIYCRDSRATCHIAGCSHLAKLMSRSCHIAGCNNSIRHIENRFSPYFFLFFNAVWGLTSGGFRIVSDKLVNFSRKTRKSLAMIVSHHKRSEDISFWYCLFFLIKTGFGHIPRDIFPPGHFPSFLHGVKHFLSSTMLNHHLPIYSIKRSTVNVYKIDRVDRFRSTGGRLCGG